MSFIERAKRRDCEPAKFRNQAYFALVDRLKRVGTAETAWNRSEGPNALTQGMN
jgi:hypothetical protein